MRFHLLGSLLSRRGVSIALAAQRGVEYLQLQGGDECFLQTLSDLLETVVLMQALHKVPKMQVKAPGAFLAFHRTSEAVAPASEASHCVCVAAERVHARDVGKNAMRVIGTYVNPL